MAPSLTGGSHPLNNQLVRKSPGRSLQRVSLHPAARSRISRRGKGLCAANPLRSDLHRLPPCRAPLQRWLFDGAHF
jgi:hypothetical protein